MTSALERVAVTGGASGLGAAVVEAVRKHGGTAVALDVREPAAEVPWVEVDLSDPLAASEAVHAAEERIGPLTGVVTAASTLGLRALSDATAYCASKFGVVGFSRALAVETAGRVGVTMLVPGGMRTAFFDGRPEQYKPGPDAMLNDPEAVAETIVYALSQPAGVEIRELV